MTDFKKWFAARARNPDRITLEEAFNAGKQSAQSVPEGWKLAPIVPVQEMSEAGVYAGGIYYDVVDAVYEAMIKIAPEYKPCP